MYLDHAATTPLDPRVLQVMLPYMTEVYGNPSSFHTPGKEAHDALEQARTRIARRLRARADEILFTSGGTESDALAILGYVRANKQKGTHIIVSAFEHHAVLECALHLERKEGVKVTYLAPDKDGFITPEAVIAAVQPDTILVSIMMANNEIGTIQPVAEIVRAVKTQRKDIVVHTDACQVTGAMPIDVSALGVDLLTINASKIYGPKGAGCLFIKRGIKLQPLMFGGSQERGWRPGTENLAAIMGFATALELAQDEAEEEAKRLTVLRDKLVDGLLERVKKSRVNGSREHRLPNNANISFLDVEGEALLLYLDAAGIYAATGSACTSASLDPSHVILSLGLPYEVAHGSLRFTLGRSTTEADIEYVLETLPPLVEKLRAISPVRVDEKYYT